MKRPNVFIVGGPKCGTTSLWTWLGRHPDVFVSEKEPNFFNKDMHRDSDAWHGTKKFFPYRTEEKYLKLFSEWGDEKVCCEATPRYLFSEVAAKEIFDFNPDAKIIIMLRERMSYLRSLHQQHFNNGDEDVEDFGKALMLEPLRKEYKMIPRNCKCPSLLWYCDWADFPKQIQRFVDVFPAEQIKIIHFGEFTSLSEKVFCDVLRFLGIDDSFTTDFGNLNPAKEMRSTKIKCFLADPDHPLKNFLRVVIPNSLHQPLFSGVRKLNTKVKK